jgi:hypothetical protein
MTEINELTPIPVRIVSGADMAASAKKCHYDVTLRTIRLTAANPVQVLCAADLSREGILIQAFTNDIVICETQSKAQDPANSATANPGFPEGYLLAKANTTPTWLPMTDLAYVTAGTFPAQVTIALVNKVEG